MLISTQIINPASQDSLKKLRQSRSEEITRTLQDIDNQLNTNDPVDKTFFNGRMQDPKDGFFAEYIDRKFGVKQYQELAKKAREEAHKKGKKNKERTPKKPPIKKGVVAEPALTTAKDKQAPVVSQGEVI